MGREFPTWLQLLQVAGTPPVNVLDAKLTERIPKKDPQDDGKEPFSLLLSSLNSFGACKQAFLPLMALGRCDAMSCRG